MSIKKHNKHNYRFDYGLNIKKWIKQNALLDTYMTRKHKCYFQSIICNITKDNVRRALRL